MIALSLEKIALVTHGALSNNVDIIISEVSTDTRSITSGCLFVALRGEHFDSHEFAKQAIAAGAAALLVNKFLQLNVPQVVVSDTRIALGNLAAFVRRKLKPRVVALTGSSGKTSVKEMTASILCQCGETLYTRGNLNNEIGVPLTLLRLTDVHQYAVIELGANHQGEISWTSSITHPESVLVNNLAIAHLEGFGSLAGVAKAKSEIFIGLEENGTAIINLDSNDLPNWKFNLMKKRIWSFSGKENNKKADFYATNVKVSKNFTTFTLHTPQNVLEIKLPLLGRHNVTNAIAASALAFSVGATQEAISRGLAILKAIPGRLFPVILNQRKILLDDSYNANVSSMIAAAQVLSEMPGYRVMVSGDMSELGVKTVKWHCKVGKAIREAGIDKVLSIGVLSQYISSFSGIGEHFSSNVKLIARIQSILSEYQVVTILVKGSRSASMEQVVKTLQEKGAC